MKWKKRDFENMVGIIQPASWFNKNFDTKTILRLCGWYPVKDDPLAENEFDQYTFSRNPNSINGDVKFQGILVSRRGGWMEFFTDAEDYPYYSRNKQWIQAGDLMYYYNYGTNMWQNFLQENPAYIDDIEKLCLENFGDR